MNRGHKIFLVGRILLDHKAKLKLNWMGREPSLAAVAQHFDFAQGGEPVEPDEPSFVEINNSPRAQLNWIGSRVSCPGTEGALKKITKQVLARRVMNGIGLKRILSLPKL